MPRRWDWDQYINVGGIGAKEAREAEVHEQAEEEERVEREIAAQPAILETPKPKLGPAVHHPNVVMRTPKGSYHVGQRVTVEVGRRGYARMLEQYELEAIAVELDEKDATVEIATFKRADAAAAEPTTAEPASAG